MMNANNRQSKKKSVFIPVLLVLLGALILIRQPILGLFSKASVTVNIEHAPVIMPAVYKVYANEDALDGKYGLFKMLVSNNSSITAQNVEVSYQIPGYIEWESIQKIPVILPGQSVVVNCFPSFNQKIVEKTTSSKEKVHIKITGTNLEETGESFPIEIKGRNEFMYTFIPFDEIRSPGEFFDNSMLISCFVTPEDPIIKYFTQKIQEKILKGEDAVVAQTAEEGVRFMAGIYNATYVSHMVYSGTSGVPSDVNGVSSVTQSIRLPREVVTGKTGLCIELSILYASIMMNAGLDPVIFFIPGHAYPGFKMNGQYYAIEATGIGGEGMKGGRASAEQAFQTGMKELQEFMKGAQMGDDRYQVLDVREAIKNGAVAMELTDDPFLRQKIDEIAQSFEPNMVMASTPMMPNQPMNNGGNNMDNGGGNTGGNTGGNSGGNTGAPAGYRMYNGAVTFAYPVSWQSQQPSPQSPSQLKKVLMDPSNMAYLEIYQFPGVQSAEQGIMIVQQSVSSRGGQLQYSPTGKSGNFSLFQGQTEFQGTGIQWVAAFKPVQGGIAGIAVGTMSGYGGEFQTSITTILNSLR